MSFGQGGARVGIYGSFGGLMPSPSRYVVKCGKGSDDVMFSRSFIGGHLGLGGEEDNSEQSRLLSSTMSIFD